MELLNNLYSIQEQTDTGFKIRLNPDCIIYKAHFPGNPITPGVCLIEMVRTLAEQAVGNRLSLNFVKNVKFLSVVSPVQYSELNIDLNITGNPNTEQFSDDKTLKTQAIIFFGDTVFAKMSLIFKSNT